MTHLFQTRVIASLLAACALPGLCLAQPHYDVTELPSPGGTFNNVVWVGADGSMAGSFLISSASAPTSVATSQCYIYRDGKFTIIDTPGYSCYARAGNSGGDLAGVLVRTAGITAATMKTGVAFLYRNGTVTPLTLPETSGVANSAATAINDQGDLTGNLTWLDPTRLGYVVDGWTLLRDVPSLLPELGGHSTYPHAINELGDVAADSLTAAGAAQQQHAVVITRAGALIDLGTLGGSTATASDINLSGQVVGQSTVAAGALPTGFFYNGVSMIPIQVSGATQGTSAASLNDAAEVVGNYYTTDDKGLTQSHAFYYANGQSIDLDDQVQSGPPGVYLIFAAAIYNDGRILAFGGVPEDSATHTYLLTPSLDTASGALVPRPGRRR